MIDEKARLMAEANCARLNEQSIKLANQQSAIDALDAAIEKLDAALARQQESLNWMRKLLKR